MDASKQWLVALLLQVGQWVAYVCSSSTFTVITYAQIKKEMYAIVFSCEGFHQYVCGRSDCGLSSYVIHAGCIAKPSEKPNL